VGFFVVFFFFQAEDGIRDGHVTGVQTCALPILLRERVYRYLEADLVVSTDGVAPELIARRLNDRLASRGIERGRIELPGSPHEATVGTRLRPLLASTLDRLAVSGTAVIVSDPILDEAAG